MLVRIHRRESAGAPGTASLNKGMLFAEGLVSERGAVAAILPVLAPDEMVAVAARATTRTATEDRLEVNMMVVEEQLS